MIDLLAQACLLIGTLAIIFGALGLLRLPDFFARTHAASVTDTAGAGFILLGLALQAGFGLISLKLALVLVFLLMTSPTAAHALAQAATTDGVIPQGDIEDEPSAGKDTRA